jgi:hypothetical protein
MMERIEQSRRKELPLEPSDHKTTASNSPSTASSLQHQTPDAFDPFHAMHLNLQAKPTASSSLATIGNAGLPNINLVPVQGSELLASNSTVSNALSNLNAIKGMFLLHALFRAFL